MSKCLGSRFRFFKAGISTWGHRRNKGQMVNQLTIFQGKPRFKCKASNTLDSGTTIRRPLFVAWACSQNPSLTFYAKTAYPSIFFRQVQWSFPGRNSGEQIFLHLIIQIMEEAGFNIQDLKGMLWGQVSLWFWIQKDLGTNPALPKWPWESYLTFPKLSFLTWTIQTMCNLPACYDNQTRKLVWYSQDSEWLDKFNIPSIPLMLPCSAQLWRYLLPAGHSWNQLVTYQWPLDPPVIHSGSTHTPVPNPVGLSVNVTLTLPAPSAQGALKFHCDKPFQLRSYSFLTTLLSMDLTFSFRIRHLHPWLGPPSHI